VPQRHRLGVLATGVVTACGTLAPVAGVEPEGFDQGLDRPTVGVAGLQIVPVANLTFSGDRLELHPTARLLAGYDDNVFQTDSGEVDDQYGQLDAGLATRYFLSASSLVVVDLDVFHRDYREEDSRDFTGGQLDLEWLRQSDVWLLESSARYRREDDPSLDNTRTVERQTFGAQVGLRRRGNEWGWFVAGEARRTDYLEDTPFVDTDERDRDRFEISAGVRRRLGEVALVDGRIDLLHVRYLESTPLQDSFGLRPVVRYLRPVGDRSVLDLEAGLEVRQFDDDFAGDAAFDDQTVFWPHLAARYRWSYRGDSYLQASALSRLVDGTGSNAVLTWGPSLELEHELPARWELYTSAQWVQREASGAPAGRSPSESDVLTLEGEARYRLRSGFVFRSRVLWRDFDSSIERGDYQQVIVTLDASVAF